MRGRSISVKRLAKTELELGRRLYPRQPSLRPKVREDCREGERPCPFLSCKHHLYLDVSVRTGSIKLNFPDLEVHELRESCALDVADRGGATLEEVAEIMNLTRERIRQVEVKALTRLADLGAMGGLWERSASEGAVGKRRLPVVGTLHVTANDDESDERERGEDERYGRVARTA